MDEPYTYRQRTSRGTSFAAVLLALIAGAVALGFFIHHARTGFPGRLAALISGRSTTTITEPMIVDKVQRLNRLETVVYSLDTVVESDESNPVLPDVLAGDRLLMIINGQVIAGVDLSKLRPDDVTISEGPNGRAVSITLPASEIFTTTINNQKSRVYARETGLFVRADPNLETITREKAQGQLDQAALSDGILDAARQNARATIAAMLQGLGFARVTVR